MDLHNYLCRLNRYFKRQRSGANTHGKKRSQQRSYRLLLETLEDRTAPAVFNVSAGDVQGLVQAINTANSTPPKDAAYNIINLTAGSTYALSSVNNNWYGPNALPAITSALVIEGHGAVIERVGSTPLRIFYVSGGYDNSTLTPAGSLTLVGLTVEGGLAQGGAGGSGFAAGGGGAGLGGAIFNQGSLTLNAVTLTQNTAQGGDGGSMLGYSGGGGGGLGGAGGSGDLAKDNLAGAGGGGGFASVGAPGESPNGGDGGYGLQGTEGGTGGTELQIVPGNLAAAALYAGGGFGYGGTSTSAWFKFACFWVTRRTPDGPSGGR